MRKSLSGADVARFHLIVQDSADFYSTITVGLTIQPSRKRPTKNIGGRFRMP